MLYIKRTETDPYFNIAAEEYVLKNFTEECFMLWRNEPSIIVGKHQNTLAEINPDYIEKNNIPVIRRISGGGTVFHDLGNLNFTFIKNGHTEKLVDFKKFTEPIIAALASLGINAKFEGKNDLRIDGKKISGNAEHVHKNRVLHHGTLLFSSKLDHLSAALNVEPDKFKDKAVKSNRSIVTNIIDHLARPISIKEFEEQIYRYIYKNDAHASFYEFDEQDIRNINELVNTKYKRWEWNFAYSPKYNLIKSIATENGEIEFVIDVKNGIIQKLKINSDRMLSKKFAEIENRLIGKSHQKKEIENCLSKINFQEQFHTSKKTFINGLF